MEKRKTRKNVCLYTLKAFKQFKIKKIIKHICRKQQQLEDQLREKLDQKKREELRLQWDKEEKEKQEKMFVDSLSTLFWNKNFNM